eukprot:10457432-Lingulodinium_polyedra.AAC.1
MKGHLDETLLVRYHGLQQAHSDPSVYWALSKDISGSVVAPSDLDKLLASLKQPQTCLQEFTRARTGSKLCVKMFGSLFTVTVNLAASQAIDKAL